jgi:hypothetical protein
MATGFGPLAEVMWTEAERRCAVVMILTRKGDILTDSEIADLTGVDCRRVNQLRKTLTETGGPQASRFLCTKSPDGLQEGQKHGVRGISCPSHLSQHGHLFEVMESTVLPRIKTVAGDRLWVWQQDSAPCHVSIRSIEWLKDHCYDLLLAYFVWGYFETHTNRSVHTTKASLITSIKENFASMDKAFLSKM